MRIKHDDIAIPEDEPFKNCKLQRKMHADVLTSIIKGFPDGFVLSINNDWGTGKTTFLKMWRQSLINDGFRTLCFNAWENDFESAPLIAILSELKTLSPEKKEFASLLKNAATIVQHVAPVLVKAVAEKYIHAETVTKSIEELTKAAGEILKEEVKEYAKKKKGLEDFRADLQKFLSDNKTDKPVVFIIDELDRCRPDYAVEVLEKIKHFFNVPGITFVLAIDKVQLINAVRGFYGSEHINGTEYLKRFIDVEYSLPTPDYEQFAEYLFDYYSFRDYFNSYRRMNHSELQNDAASFTEFSAVLFNASNATLRQQEKIFAHAKIVIQSFAPENYVFPAVLIFLIYLKEFKKDVYSRLGEGQMDLQSTFRGLEMSFPATYDDKIQKYFLSTAARIMVFYANHYRQTAGKPADLITKDMQTKENRLTIGSNFDIDGNYLLQRFVAMTQAHSAGVSIDYFIRGIDLLNIIHD